MKKKPKIATRSGLLAVAAALAVAAPAALADDEQTVGGEKTTGGTTFEAPVAAALSVPLPSFSLTINDTTVEDPLPPALTVEGGTLILTAGGESTSPTATVAQHCGTGAAGGSISVERVSPGGSVLVAFDPGERGGGDTQELAERTVPPGARPTQVSAEICQGLE